MSVSSAGIAFYGLLALVPTLVALVSVYALIADPADIETQVTETAGNLDPDTQAFLTSQLKSIVGDVESQDAEPNVAARWFALVIGIGLALWSASGAVGKLMGTISLAYEAEETRSGIKLKALAYLLTTAAIIGIASFVFLIGFLPALLQDFSGPLVRLIQPLAALAGFGLGTAALYRYAPDMKPNRTQWLNPGSAVAAVLIAIFTMGFSFYSANVGAMPGSYGLLGSIAAIMILLQLMATAIILGAETNGYLLQQAETQAVAPIRQEETRTEEQIPFSKALLGLIVLFVLGRSNDK